MDRKCVVAYIETSSWTQSQWPCDMGGEAERHKLASYCFLLSLKANLKTMQKQIVRIEE